MSVIYGIDLGTTFTKCALVRPSDGNIEIFKLDKDDPTSPQNTLPILRSAVTVAMLPDGRPGAYVGMRSLQELDQWSEGDPAMMRFEESKIWIGERTNISEEDAPPWHYEPHGWKYRPEDVGAIVLRKVKKEVEATGRPSMNRVVVTHPHYFTDSRAKATRQAVELAGLELVDTLTEPNAVAVAFGAEASPGRYMVFDFGGGTLDVTVAQIDETGSVRVLGADGMKKAGRDFDRVIFGMMVDAYRSAYRDFDPFFLDSKSKQTWMREAEKAKRQLNSPDQPAARIRFGCVNDRFQGQQKRLDITRDQFFQASQPIVDDAVSCARQALENAKLRWTDLRDIWCVGGSSRLIHMMEALAGASGRRLETGIDADTAIAQGAALYAESLEKRSGGVGSSKRSREMSKHESREVRLVGALARSLGIRAYSAAERRAVIVPLLPVGRAIPCREKKVFRTTEDNQTVIPVELYEGEEKDPDLCELVGTVELTGVAPGPRGQPVEVAIEVEVNGTKHLIADTGSVRREAVITFDPDKVMPDTELAGRRSFLASLVIV